MFFLLLSGGLNRHFISAPLRVSDLLCKEEKERLVHGRPLQSFLTLPRRERKRIKDPPPPSQSLLAVCTFTARWEREQKRKVPRRSTEKKRFANLQVVTHATAWPFKKIFDSFLCGK